MSPLQVWVSSLYSPHSRTQCVSSPQTPSRGMVLFRGLEYDTRFLPPLSLCKTHAVGLTVKFRQSWSKPLPTIAEAIRIGWLQVISSKVPHTFNRRRTVAKRSSCASKEAVVQDVSSCKVATSLKLANGCWILSLSTESTTSPSPLRCRLNRKQLSMSQELPTHVLRLFHRI